jgi:hypothetical protein
MAFFKALLIGVVFDLIVSAVIHGGGSSGGFLYIDELLVAGHYVHWSWPLFVVGTGLVWGILMLMR